MAVLQRRGDFAYQTPELLGSQRTGPDLTNIGARQPSAVWQYIHLYNPRAVVPESVMPAFDWMFQVVDHVPPGATPIALPKAYAPAVGVVVPTHEAQALLAYLLSLKQPALPGDAAENGGAMPAIATSSAGAATAANTSAPASAGAAALPRHLLAMATTRPRGRRCSLPIARPATRQPAKACPERFLR